MKTDLSIGVYCTLCTSEPRQRASREALLVSDGSKASVRNGFPDVQPFSHSSTITVQRNKRFVTSTDFVGISTELCKITGFERTGNDNRRTIRIGRRNKSYIRCLTVCCHGDSRCCRQ